MTTNYPSQYNRRSIRLPDYDYSQPGYYFVTMCAKNREYLFGEIKDGKMVLNELGKIIEDCWLSLPKKYLNQIELDEYVIMPNHVHGIIHIQPATAIAAIQSAVRAIHESPRQPKLIESSLQQRRKMLLPKIVGYFKMNSAKSANQFRNLPGFPLWQRDYYEHIVRSEESLYYIRNYIINNPLMWDKDRNSMDNLYL